MIVLKLTRREAAALESVLQSIQDGEGTSIALRATKAILEQIQRETARRCPYCRTQIPHGLGGNSHVKACERRRNV